jgi:hypothetical protein
MMALVEVDGCIFDEQQLGLAHGFESLDPVAREAVEFASTADSSQSGEYPERDQQSGIGGVAAAVVLDRFDLSEPSIKIKLADQAPNVSSRGFGIEPLVERAPAHFDWVALRDAEPWPAAAKLLSDSRGRGLWRLRLDRWNQLLERLARAWALANRQT